MQCPLLFLSANVESIFQGCHRNHCICDGSKWCWRPSKTFLFLSHLAHMHTPAHAHTYTHTQYAFLSCLPYVNYPLPLITLLQLQPISNPKTKSLTLKHPYSNQPKCPNQAIHTTPHHRTLAIIVVCAILHYTSMCTFHHLTTSSP